MSLLFENEEIKIVKPIFEERSEFKLETDIYLPDYLPDIQKLLRCHIIPRETAVNIMTSQIDIEGEAEIRVFYKPVGEEKTCCITVLKEFINTFTPEYSEPDLSVTTNTSAMINSARASGSRKISLKCEISTDICGYSASVVEIAKSTSDLVECEKESINAISEFCIKEREIRITEELQLPDSCPSIETLCYTDANVINGCISVIGGSLQAKGELKIIPTYCDENGSLHNAEFKIPISQIIEAGEVREDYCLNVYFKTVSIYAESENDESGKRRIIDCETVINIIVIATKSNDYHIITDAFAPRSEISIDFSNKKYLSSYGTFSNNEAIHGKINCENDIENVINVFSDAKIIRSSFNDGCCIIEGIVTCDAVYKSIQGFINSKNEEIPFKFTYSRDTYNSLYFNTICVIEGTTYTISSNTSIEVKCDIKLTSTEYSENELNAITQINIIGNKETCRSYPISLYFAESGENVWNIAKEFDSSVAEIMTENEMESKNVSKATMLIIPQKF